jgi:hypothetical protein
VKFVALVARGPLPGLLPRDRAPRRPLTTRESRRGFLLQGDDAPRRAPSNDHVRETSAPWSAASVGSRARVAPIRPSEAFIFEHTARSSSSLPKPCSRSPPSENASSSLAWRRSAEPPTSQPLRRTALAPAKPGSHADRHKTFHAPDQKGSAGPDSHSAATSLAAIPLANGPLSRPIGRLDILEPHLTR